ncbi:hypothetical protein F4X33_22030 [Candidatus Poribacteria bacterium]|nr:hypothetical protein [Candidatus Poribacteria bacterium]
MDIEGNRFKNFAESLKVDKVGSWSPDGSTIVFFSNQDENRKIDVTVSDGAKVFNLTRSPREDQASAGSPNVRWAAYHPI